MPVNLVERNGAIATFGPSTGASAPNFDGTFVAPAPNTGTINSNLQQASGNFDGVFDASPGRTGTIAVTLGAAAGEFQELLNNQGRVDAVLSGRSPHFAFSYPADPVTTRDVTVNTASEFNTEAAVAGTRITVGSSFTGNVVIAANDIDVVMDNGLTISGNFQISASISRIRWTGGNIGTMGIANCDDVLFDDLLVYSDSSTAILSQPNNMIGAFGTCNRVFCINSTFQLEHDPGTPSNLYQWAMNASGTTDPRASDYFFGNCKFETIALGQNNRFQSLSKLMLVDCVMNPTHISGSGLRIHWCEDVWIRDSWFEGQGNLTNTASSPSPTVANGLLDNVDGYNSFYATYDGTNTGTIQNTTLFGGTLSIGPFTDGGGNSSASWDGSTLPDSSGVGAIRP